MKRAALFVLSLVLILPLTLSLGESPASALTCPEQCYQDAFQCQQSCQGTVGAVRLCRDECAAEYHVCLANCP